MREAVIVSYARTGLAKSGRGGFNITPPMSMAAHAIKHAVERSGVEKDFVEDCYLGNNAHGAANIGRQAALLAGMPVTTAGVSINRMPIGSGRLFLSGSHNPSWLRIRKNA